MRHRRDCDCTGARLLPGAACSLPHTAKPVNVISETDIGITGIFIVAITRATVLSAESPGATAKNFVLAFARPSRVLLRRLLVIVHFVKIVAPFPDVAAHVEK